MTEDGRRIANSLFAQLPAVDRLLSEPQQAPLLNRYGVTLATAGIRALLAEARGYIKSHNALPDWLAGDAFSNRLNLWLAQQTQSSLRPVFNLTGVVLHTNLGRARLSDAAIAAVTQAMREAVTLEYDINHQQRGHRDQAVSDVLCELTGAQAACVLNNNAAAVLLMFAAMADGREAIASRGELIEIGGSFRIPDVMRQANCKLVEVGTTNRTHLKDYRNAINANTALMVKVHTSNYRIEGFTAEVSAAELAELGHAMHVPVAADLGSGTLIALEQYGLAHETTVQEVLQADVDLISFSGDKLLGGPQAGIVLGRKEYIERLQSHPLKRALRCDKMTLAALEATLKLYLRPDQLTANLPTLRHLSRSVAAITADVETLLPVCQRHYGEQFMVASEACLSQIGSGALPTATIASRALTFTPLSGRGRELEQLAERWHNLAQPIIGRIADGRMWLDCRCLDDVAALARQITEDGLQKTDYRRRITEDRKVLKA